MTHDPKCFDLADHFLDGVGIVPRSRARFQWELAQAIQDAIEDFLADIGESCTCRLAPFHATDVDPPHHVLDKWCPVHGGLDPDEELEKRRDAQAEEREP